MAKKTNINPTSPKKFSDLSQLKKSIPITFNNETICRVEELTANELVEFNRFIFTNVSETIEMNEANSVIKLSDKGVAYLLRKMVKDIEIENLSDEEILESFNSMGNEVSSQFTKAIEILAIKHIEQMLTDVTANITKQAELITKLKTPIQEVE